MYRADGFDVLVYSEEAGVSKTVMMAVSDYRFEGRRISEEFVYHGGLAATH
jgi:hypothetical protein